MISDDVVQRVRQHYPGVHLESTIQGCVYLESFEEGVARYNQLSDPSPQDDRWVGVCYFQLFQDERALSALAKAVTRGETAARVNLAHLYRFIDQPEDAAREFELVDPTVLSPYDLVLFFRTQSLQEETNGNIRRSLQLAEEAWRKVQGIPEFGLLAPSILGQLGVLYGRIGHAQRALWYIERGLTVTDGIEANKVKLKRASLLISLGRTSEAINELNALGDLGSIGLNAERLAFTGQAHWTNSNLSTAVELFERAIDLSVEAKSSYEELFSRLPLAAIEIYKKNLAAAQTHLKRSQLLITDKSDHLSYKFREVQYQLASGVYSNDYALLEFAGLSDEFGNMGLLQEQGWVRLHMADILLRTGKPGLEQEIEVLKTLAVSLQNPAFLTRELIFLPELREYLQRCAPTLVGAGENALEVRTLGTEALVFRGAEVHIPLRKTVEVLAYVLEHKSVRLDKVVEDVFPDSKARAARSYFHQVRHHLAAEVPGLDIHYDRESKLYHLKSELDVLWDVAEVRAGRYDSPPGSFLPSSANRWTDAVDRELERYRTREG